MVFRNVRVLLCESAYMCFVDDGFVPWRSQRSVRSPAKARLCHHRQRRVRRVVSVIEGKVLLRITDAISKHRIRPCDVTSDCFGVGVQDDFIGIKPMPALRIIRSVDAIAVQLSWTNIRQKAVPDKVRLFAHRDAVDFFLRIHRIEQAEFDARCVRREQRKVNSVTFPCGSQRIRATGPDANR